MSYQLIILKGNLTKDAEVRQLQAQDGTTTTIAKIDIACGSSYIRRDGQKVEEVEYFNNIEIWNKPGVTQFLTKGQQVLVQCVQKTEKYTDQQGQQREVKKYRCQAIDLCGSRPQAQPSAPAPQYQQTPPPPAYPQASASQPTYPTPPPAYQQPQMPPQYPQSNSEDIPF